MRVTLLNPLPGGDLQTHRHGVGHLGLGYVAACLVENGHEVRVIDAKAEGLAREQVLQRLREQPADLFGCTAMTHEIHEAGEVCAAVKEMLPGCVTMVGGPHGTALPERTLREFAGIDAVVVGEGERTACELAGAVAAGGPRSGWRGIAGLAYRDGTEIVRTAPRAFIEDLDALPFPAWRLFPPTVRWPVFAGRGCPFRCAFCQRVLGGRVRMRSPDNVLAEFDAMEEVLGARGTWFQDETFAVSRRWTEEFLDKLIERNRRKGYVWSWKANSRANLADGALYRRMKQAGCYTLDFGLESGSPEMLERIHKNITPSQARRAIGLARGAGLKTHAFFIIGHPGETWQTALQTVRFAARCGADDIAVGVMVPYPGTEVYELAREGRFGYRLLSEDWRVYDKYFGGALELRTLSRRELEWLQVLTYLWFHAGRGQVCELLRFVSTFRREALAMLRRLLPLP